MSSEPDRAALAHATDHIARGLSQLTHRWRGLPGVSAILSSHLAEVQAIEDALWSILAIAIDTASGDQLAQIGALLGEPKVTLSDAKWRVVLRARIDANRSAGTLDELLAILLRFADVGDVTAEECFPAGVLFTASALTAGFPPARVGGLLRRATAGGVGVQLVAPASGATAFRFASADDVETAVGTGFSDVTQASGGHLAGVY